MLKSIRCRFCRTFVVQPTETRHGLVFRRDEHTMMTMLRNHVAGRHRTEWRQIERALTPPNAFVPGRVHPRWSAS